MNESGSVMSATLRCFCLSAALMAACLPAHADSSANDPENNQTPSAGAMAADALLLRPLSLAGTALGVGIFLAGLPFELASNSVPAASHRLIVEPGAFTFTRPLGETK
jgi:hypothetical protein